MPGFWALYHGEQETAATVHVLAEKLDNGEILLQRHVRIDSGDTWDSLITKTKEAAGHALIETILQMEAGTINRRPNPDDEASYFSVPTWRDAREFRRRGCRMF